MGLKWLIIPEGSQKIEYKTETGNRQTPLVMLCG